MGKTESVHNSKDSTASSWSEDNENDQIISGDSDKRNGAKTKIVSHAELAEYFHLPINDAAKELKMCVTVLKKQCRSHGVRRWPYRKLKALDKLAQRLQREGTLATDPEFYNIELQSLHDKKYEVLNGSKAPKQSHPGPTIQSFKGAPTPQNGNAQKRPVGDASQMNSLAEARHMNNMGVYGGVRPVQQDKTCPAGCTECAHPVPPGMMHPFYGNASYPPVSNPTQGPAQPQMYQAPYSQMYGPRMYPYNVNTRDSMGRMYMQNSFEMMYPRDRHVAGPQLYQVPTYNSAASNVDRCNGHNGYCDRCPPGKERQGMPHMKRHHTGMDMGQMHADYSNTLPTSIVTNEITSTGHAEEPKAPSPTKVQSPKKEKPQHERHEKHAKHHKHTSSKRKEMRDHDGGNSNGQANKRARRDEALMSDLHSLAHASAAALQRAKDKRGSESISNDKQPSIEDPPSSHGQESDEAPDFNVVTTLPVLSSLRMNLWTADSNWIITSCSGAELTSFNNEALRRGTRIFRPESDKEYGEADRKVYSSAKNGIVSQRIYKVKGKKHLQITGPLKDSSGSIVGICGANVEVDSI
eukprot:CAMPEP_0198731980 /NCGR_PEP_ID=MMETSP1475-20131203/33136_1 /TAXON_ID= ORGANISM="Unidentified sp., Strain CCMP1999" /NCGR_SAMPLE_ID=MMETSP1475 /ASSEMBLY_ACC=CAM_ASM_001111 /LENGTH=579 /DNA_ID=CAMNT_0044495009 /DNA_START=249 /DNA_END=1988 /DNA_ORIENTATION=-